MDPISAASALVSSPGGGLLGSGGVAGTPNVLIHQSGGQSFAFKLPEPVQAPAELGSFPATQVYAVGNEPTTYGHLAQQMIGQVNQLQAVAGEKVRDVLMGGKTTVNDAMVSVQESGVAFQLLSEVRNKLVDSYQQIMSMQI